MPVYDGRLIEPFVGGGAVFFEHGDENSIISDKNTDLFYTYITVRDNLELLKSKLKKHSAKNSPEYFAEIRSWDRVSLGKRYFRRSIVNRASRFIYLNKTAFNGMYRVNLSGEYNVPYGNYKNPNIFDEFALEEASTALQGVEILNADFAEVARKAVSGDFVYFDPPYAPLSQTESFTAYTKDGFDRNEQERLRNLCLELSERGVFVMVSNSNADLIKSLYGTNNFKIHKVTALRSINSNGTKRKGCTELIITNYDKHNNILK